MQKQITSFINKNKTFLLLLALSPGFWWNLLQPSKVFNEWLKSPNYASQKLSSIYSKERLDKVGSLRWAHRGDGPVTTLVSKVFYNKLTILGEEVFNFSGFLSPRFYFLAGDGDGFSPPSVEPAPVILFPFWVFGILVLTKKKTMRPIALMFIFTFLAFILGRRNLAFLFPALIANIYISSIGLGVVCKSNMRYLWVIALYGVFIMSRLAWFVL